MKKRILSILVLVAVVISLCIGVSAVNLKDATAGETQNTITEKETAVLTENSTMTDCQSYTTAENGQISQWIPVENQTLHAGDLVFVTEEKDGTAVVTLPSGDTPGIFGKLPTKVLTQDPEKLQLANQANAKGVMGYDQIDGQETEELLGWVEIIDRQEDWCQVKAIAGGSDTTVWVRAADLSYQWDGDESAMPTPPEPSDPVKLPFTDVAETDWFYPDAAYVFETGMMNGTSETLFSPQANTTRAMIVTILWRLEQEPSAVYEMQFKDVLSEQWYTDSVRWAAANEIVSGYNTETFGPNDPITREQLAAILYRYAAYKKYDVSAQADLSQFADCSKLSSWAEPAMSWANGTKLIQGTDKNQLAPQNSANRAQASAILHRFCDHFIQ